MAQWFAVELATERGAAIDARLSEVNEGLVIRPRAALLVVDVWNVSGD